MTLDIKETINNFYNEVGLNPKDYPNPVSAWKNPLSIPPPNRPTLDIHQEWVNTFNSSGLPSDSIGSIHGEEQFWNKPPKPIDPTKPQPTLSEDDKKKIAFYDDLNNYFKGNIPTDLKSQWESLSKWPPKFSPDDLETSFNIYSIGKDCKLNHLNYDTIRQNLGKWTSLFPSPLTPEQVKKKFDEPSAVDLSEDDKFRIKDYDRLKNEYNKLVGVEGKLIVANAEIVDLKQKLNQALANKPSPGPTPTPIISGVASGKVWDAYAHLLLDPGVATNYNTFRNWAMTLTPQERSQIRYYYNLSLNNANWLKARLSLFST